MISKDDTKIYKAAWQVHLIFLVILSPLYLVSILNVYLDPLETSLWSLLLTSVLFLFAFTTWINSYKITLLEDKISYKSLLQKEKTFNYSDISKIEIIPGKGGSIGFNIHSTTISKPIIIAYNMFNKGVIHEVLVSLVEKQPNLELNDFAKKIKDKDFKDINRAAIINILTFSVWIMILFATIGLLRHFYN